ncbi:MAG: hypothetical protein LPK28_01635, partial [Bacteroidota bacterium]|nr:hypothetical protein [Bacteroidota bacterium]
MRLPSSLFFLRFLFVFTGIVLIVIGGFLTSDSIPPNPYLGVQPDLPDPDGVQWKYLNRAAGRGAIISGLFILLSQVVLAY